MRKGTRIYRNAGIALLSCGLILSGCVREKEYPNIPIIKFEYYASYTPDSADCVISFTDGDGDIGIDEDDSSTPDDLLFKYLYLDPIDNEFKPYDVDASIPGMDTLFKTYRVPNLTPEGSYKALNGEIRAKFRKAPLYYPLHKIVKFEIRLRDRAGNLSNIVETNPIVVKP